ncbi:TPA: transposase, partial [Escherichia coli]|nr:transposase [Escherichia coli]
MNNTSPSIRPSLYAYVLGPEKRRRRTTQEKIAIVQQSFEPGMTVSLVA